MAIQDVVEYVETVVKENITLTGTNVFPSEKQMTKLFAQIHEENGRFEGRSAGWGQSFHSIAVYVLGAKSNMAQTFKQLERQDGSDMHRPAGRRNVGRQL